MNYQDPKDIAIPSAAAEGTQTQQGISRRSFLMGAAACALFVPLASLLTACASDDSSAEGAQSTEPAATEDAAASSAGAAASSSILVAYFSATGHTKEIGDMLADHFSADTFEITPAQPYTAEDLDYNDDDSRTNQEHASNARVELVQVTPDNFDAYDTVFLGYPIWWGDASWVLHEFVSGNDFSGKTVIPFCTSASSPLGSSAENLAALTGAGDWLAGQRFDIGASEDEVTSWADGLGI